MLLNSRRIGFTLCSIVLLSLAALTELPAAAQERELPGARAREGAKHARDLTTAFQEVTQSVSPSVVNIRSTRRIAAVGPGGTQLQPLDPDMSPEDLFEYFFRGRTPRRDPRDDSQSTPRRDRGMVQRGIGTGVIVSKDGYILTNNHVVGEAEDISVTVAGNRTLAAKVVGTDPMTDLAVIQVNANDLTPAELGDSDAVEVGEWVVAVGSPFGLSNTVTAGIISAKGRANVGIVEYEDFIQTDAAINPGNSGGPLLNLDGKVIGINTAIATRTGYYQGVGFATPINMARQVMDAIIHEGKVVRGWIGVAIQNLTPELADSFDFKGTDGALIGDVSNNGPADKAGLRAGDIIVGYNGRPIRDMNQLRNAVAATKPGSKAEFEIVREGKREKVTVEIGEREDQGVVARAAPEPQEDLGMSYQNLTPALRSQLNLEEKEGGVVVTQVEPGGIAEKSGLVTGDVVVSVNGKPVAGLDEFRGAIRGADLDKGIRLRVKNREMQRFVILKR